MDSMKELAESGALHHANVSALYRFVTELQRNGLASPYQTPSEPECQNGFLKGCGIFGAFVIGHLVLLLDSDIRGLETAALDNHQRGDEVDAWNYWAMSVWTRAFWWFNSGDEYPSGLTEKTGIPTAESTCPPPEPAPQVDPVVDAAPEGDMLGEIVSPANVLGGSEPMPIAPGVKVHEGDLVVTNEAGEVYPVAPAVVAPKTYICSGCAKEYPENEIRWPRKVDGDLICENCWEEEQTRPDGADPVPEGGLTATEPEEGPLHG